MSKRNNGLIVGLVILFAILVVVVPLGFIWAANTLFGLGIEYTLTNWAATTLLGIFFRGTGIKTGKE